MNEECHIDVDWNRLNYMRDMFPTPQNTFDFFKKNSNYFGIHTFDNRSKKFSSREEDRTPSTLAKKRLTTIDFGGSYRHKSILDFIMDRENDFLRESLGELAARNSEKYMKYSSRESQAKAIEILSNLLGLESDIDLKNYVYIPPEPEPIIIRPPFKENYIKRLLRDSKKPKNKAVFEKIIKGLFRSCSESEIKTGIERFSVGYDEYEVINEENTVEVISRVFISERDEKGVCYGSYRYNRELTPKGLRRKHSKKVLIGSHLIKDFDLKKPVIFAEGHSDVVVNNAKSLQTLTSGAATISIEDNLYVLKGMHLHFYPDNDLSGMKGVSDKIAEIEIYNRGLDESDKIKYKVFFWSNKIDGEEFDLELLQRDWMETFIDNNDELSSKDFDSLLNAIDFEKWSQVFKDSKKKGYDFVDFHQDEKDGNIPTEAYNKFLEKYKY